ncbi:MAG: N(4)-(beta-N-acetylglucosaminyl)-L-asparaginase [Acidobacteria bacterium]|nr:N(4)-(beta-N-acetylglucosaminyl)-L-asparaginase [Acidobacteriota bacterium]
MKFSRRKFLAATAVGSASAAFGLESQEGKNDPPQPAGVPRRPAIICKVTGSQAMDGAYEMLRRGHDTLDAALFVCRAQEDDATDDSVGLGGLPNEDGVVELDACCMHGPTRRAGAVASVRDIKNVSMLARVVMERTDHLLLVGEGAERFAAAHGFPEESLLTERSRKTWLLWKEGMSNMDSWGPGLSDPKWTPPMAVPPLQSLRERYRRLEEIAERLGIEPELRQAAIERVLFPPSGTIHVSVVNEKGEMSGATTTSGLAWKIPGRVGDSPIIGAGCWTDQDVGSAGATGRGEENIKICGAHTIVENMRRGLSPRDAGLDALRRIARNLNNDMARLRFMDMVYYVLRKDGAYAGVSMWSTSPTGKPRRFAVHDGTRRVEDCVPLFQGSSIEWPPAEWQDAG